MPPPAIESDVPELPVAIRRTYPFTRRKVSVAADLAMHAVDEGSGPCVVLLHGNPTWSYLWRKVIPLLRESGLRVVAPDLVGFGLSDKPRHVRAHTLPAHVGWVSAALDALGVDRCLLVGQDWGGPIAAGLAAERPERVRGVVFANTAVLQPRAPVRATLFHRFSRLPLLSDAVFRGLLFPVPVMHRAQGDPGSIGREERRVYAAPFRRLRDRSGPLALARMVPDSESHPTYAALAAGDRWAHEYDGPAALVWGLQDPILGRALGRMRSVFPQAAVVETAAGHFLQEEVPAELAEAILDVARRAED